MLNTFKRNILFRLLATFVAICLFIALYLHFYNYNQLKTDSYILESKYKQLQKDKKDTEKLYLDVEKEKRTLNKSLEDKAKEVKAKQELLEKQEEQLGKNTLEIDSLKKDVQKLEAKKAEKLRAEKEQAVFNDTRVSQASRKIQSNDGDGWMNFTATYYDANYQSTGKHPGHPGYGVTASGRYVQTGITIAVDPSVIPLGSWVLIKFPDGHTEKRRADDTGSKINGRIIDVYIPKATLTSGRDSVQLKILK